MQEDKEEEDPDDSLDRSKRDETKGSGDSKDKDQARHKSNEDGLPSSNPQVAIDIEEVKEELVRDSELTREFGVNSNHGQILPVKGMKQPRTVSH